MIAADHNNSGCFPSGITRQVLCLTLVSLVSYALAWGHAHPAAAIESGEPVHVHLRDTASIPHAIVRVADVAELSGGTPDLRRFISQLDLDEITTPTGTTQVRRSQLLLRIRLAGVADADFRVSGSSAVSVRRDHALLTDEAVINAIREPLAKLWQLDSQSLLVRLESPLSESIKSQIAFDAQSRLEPIFRTEIIPGRLRPTIGVYRNEQLIDTFTVPISVQVERLVAMSRRNLNVGETVTVDNVIFQRKRLSGPTALQTVASEALGQHLLRPLRANELVRVFDISPEAPKEASAREPQSRASGTNDAQTMVRSRTPVVVVARRGALRVTINSAELVNSARVGDAVQVKNLSSNRVISGTLVSTSEVEVKF